VTVGLAAWALWWLRKVDSRDSFATRQPHRLTSEGTIDRAWVRQQTRPLGLALLAVAALCWLGMLGLIGFSNLISWQRTPAPEVFLTIVTLFWLLGAFSIVPLATGILALRRASYHAVAGGAWLSLLPALANIPCWPVSVGLAVWVILQLRRDDVREAFGHGRLRSVRMAPNYQNSASPVPGDTPMLAKPAKFDPFVDAPPHPRRSRIATVLLGLGLLLGGLLMLGCLLGVGTVIYYYRNSGNAQSIIETSRPLTVNIPDRRLKATLRLKRANYSGGFPIPGVAIADPDQILQITSGDNYRLIAGQYELTVKSDDVTVFSDAIHIQPDAMQPKVYEVKPGGILNLEVQTQGAHLSVDVNGHPFIQDATQKSQRMLVVPEGALRIKSYFYNHVYAEKWLELKAGEQKSVRVSEASIDEVSASASSPAAPAN
jgi:hypothetical protein